ncbi:hypothetical protein NSTC745_01627 [Nostoc sp. DSM 114161]|jgi:hypothetical protein
MGKGVIPIQNSKLVLSVAEVFKIHALRKLDLIRVLAYVSVPFFFLISVIIQHSQGQKSKEPVAC